MAPLDELPLESFRTRARRQGSLKRGISVYQVVLRQSPSLIEENTMSKPTNPYIANGRVLERYHSFLLRHLCDTNKFDSPPFSVRLRGFFEE